MWIRLLLYLLVFAFNNPSDLEWIHIYYNFFHYYQTWWRVCYQQGLPCLVWSEDRSSAVAGISWALSI